LSRSTCRGITINVEVYYINLIGKSRRLLLYIMEEKDGKQQFSTVRVIAAQDIRRNYKVEGIE
jgi:hypothetical protein